FLVQAKSMLNGVAAGDDGILQSLAAVRVATGFLAQTVGLVDRCGQYRQRISYFVQVLTCRAERVRAGWIQLDPVRVMRNLIADAGARSFGRVDDRGGQRVFRSRRIFRLRTPNDAQGRYLIAWTIEAAAVDRIPDGDVAVAVPVTGHVARGCESRVQVELC